MRANVSARCARSDSETCSPTQPRSEPRIRAFLDDSRKPKRRQRSISHISCFLTIPGAGYLRAHVRGFVRARGRTESGRWVEDPWPVWQGYQTAPSAGGLHRQSPRPGAGSPGVAWLYDKALVIVVADHGVSFIPGQPVVARTGESRRHRAGAAVHQAPGQRDGRTDMYPARTIDILPTIADVLRCPGPVGS